MPGYDNLDTVIGEESFGVVVAARCFTEQQFFGCAEKRDMTGGAHIWQIFFIGDVAYTTQMIAVNVASENAVIWVVCRSLRDLIGWEKYVMQGETLFALTVL